MSTSKVSVVILTKNRLDLLSKCVQSVLAQTYVPFELIVVDDDSTDGTVSYMQSLGDDSRVTFLQRDGRGLANGRNCGIKAARGEIIAFIDDDCTADERWLERGVDVLEREEADVVRGAAFLPDGSLFSQLDPHSLYFATLNIFYRRRVFDEVGVFDERFEHCAEDRDMGYRAVNAGHKLAIAKEAVVHHPYHYSSLKTRFQRIWFTDRPRATNRVLLYKKHEGFRHELLWGTFLNSGHLASFLLILSLLVFAANRVTINSPVLASSLLGLFAAIYLYYYVVRNAALAHYPKRLLTSPYYCAADLLLTCYTIKGSFKYRFLLI